MKKLVAIFGLLALTQCAFAYIKEGTSTDIGRMQGKGYSQSMLRIIDSERERQATSGEYYTRFYENEYKKNKHNPYHKVKSYFDPLQDDGLFGSHEIQFSNRAFPDQPSRKDRKAVGSTIDNL